MAEEKLAQPEAAELPVSPQEVQIQAPSFFDKLKIHKFKILAAFLGFLVSVGAVFGAYKLGQIQVQPGPQPTPTPVAEATPTPDPTASWKTYMDMKYEYSIKYPPEMESKELEPSAAFGPTGLVAHNFIVWGPTQKPETEFYDGLAITLGIITNPEELPLRNFADQKTQPEVGERESFEEIQVGGLRGFKAVGTGLGRFTHIFLPYKTSDKVVQITATWGGEKKEEYQNTFNLMLSTFKFLPSTSSGQGEKVYCKEPRPQVCTMECIVNPPYICGSDGKSYCNECGACANLEVEWYVFQSTPCQAQ